MGSQSPDRARAEKELDEQALPDATLEPHLDEDPQPQLETAELLLAPAPEASRDRERGSRKKQVLALGAFFAVGAVTAVLLSMGAAWLSGVPLQLSSTGARPTVASSILEAIRRLRSRPIGEFFSMHRGAQDSTDPSAEATARVKLTFPQPRVRMADTALRTPDMPNTFSRGSVGFVVAGLPAAFRPNSAGAMGLHPSGVVVEPGLVDAPASLPSNDAAAHAAAQGTHPGSSALISQLTNPENARRFKEMIDWGIKHGGTINYQQRPDLARKLLQQVPDTSRAFSGTSPIFSPGGDLPSQEYLTAQGETNQRAHEIDLHPPQVTPVCGIVRTGSEGAAEAKLHSANSPVRSVHQIGQLIVWLDAVPNEAVLDAQGKDHENYDYCCINERWAPPDTRYQADVNQCTKMTPLVFDLGGKGAFVSDRWIAYDLRGSGTPQSMHDIAARSGLLVFDASRNGAAGSSGAGTFGDRTSLAGGAPDGYLDGFEALAAFVAKAQREGVLDGGTAARGLLGQNDLRALERAYGLAMRVGSVHSKPVSLEKVGIRSIRLSAATSAPAAELGGVDGMIRRPGATFERSDGTSGTYVDVLFQVLEPKPLAGAGSPEWTSRIAR